MRLVMRHPGGTLFEHTGSLWQKVRDWRAWEWNYRNGYRFGWKRWSDVHDPVVIDYLSSAKATTEQIASQFGMTLRQTRKGMGQMETAGKVVARGYYWEAASP